MGNEPTFRNWVDFQSPCPIGQYIELMNESLLDMTPRCQRQKTGQTKEYKIGICCYSAKHAALKNKSKDWFAHNHDSVSE
jgi:hypothetical protein